MVSDIILINVEFQNLLLAGLGIPYRSATSLSIPMGDRSIEKYFLLNTSFLSSEEFARVCINSDLSIGKRKEIFSRSGNSSKNSVEHNSSVIDNPGAVMIDSYVLYIAYIASLSQLRKVDFLRVPVKCEMDG